jgi:ABC-type proline/glycine betaine transport system ATPase subunit
MLYKKWKSTKNHNSLAHMTNQSVIMVVMGVAGSGKSVVGAPTIRKSKTCLAKNESQVKKECKIGRKGKKRP